MRTFCHAGGMRSLRMRARLFWSSTGAPSGLRYVKPFSFVPSRRMPCRSRYQRRRTPFVGMIGRILREWCLLREAGSDQRVGAWAVTAIAIAVAVTRFLALSRSLWDWDEALFCLALHDYDVA